MALDEWLTTHEAALLAGYHEDHVRRLVRAGEISARKWGVGLMINRQSLIEYLVRIETRGAKRGPKVEK